MNHRNQLSRISADVRLRSRRHCRMISRPSFTLVELLIVMMFIALLATMMLFGLHGVMEEARASRTRAQIDKINQLIMDRWESYRTRPVRLLPAQMSTNAGLMARHRLNALRELMRMEMPDRMSDVFGNQVVLAARPALSQRYLNRATAGWSPAFQDSECLYLILASMQDGDSNGLDTFKSTEIDDLDGDGMKEILDAWGTPVRFLRWPAGAITPLQPDRANPAVSRLPPDPFDPLRADLRFPGPPPHDTDATNDPYALFPMIYSAGPDRQFGVWGDDTGTGIFYNSTNPFNDPYVILPNATAANGGVPVRVGSPQAPFGDAADNISNHLTGTNQ